MLNQMLNAYQAAKSAPSRAVFAKSGEEGEEEASGDSFCLVEVERGLRVSFFPFSLFSLLAKNWTISSRSPPPRGDNRAVSIVPLGHTRQENI